MSADEQKQKSHNQQSFNERKESTQQQKDMHTLISLMKSKLAQNIEDEISQKKEYLKELSKQKESQIINISLLTSKHEQGLQKKDDAKKNQSS